MVELIKIRNFDEFEIFKRNNIGNHLQVEKLIAKENKQVDKWFYPGFCELCGKATKFELNWNDPLDGNPRFRVLFICEFCKMPNRKRFMLSYLKKMINNSQKKFTVFMYESITDIYIFVILTINNII